MIEWLSQNEGPLAYALLGLSAAIEYVFPPFPGDVLALVGVALAISAGFDVSWVYAVLTAGSVLGTALVYGAGRKLGSDPQGWPGFLRGPKTEEALQKAVAAFAKHGTLLLCLNRFLPVMRAALILAAGMKRLSPLKVLAYSALSAALWNALIVAVGFWVGGNLDELNLIFERYTMAVVAGLVLIVALFTLKRRSAQKPETD